jgi:transformation/transcription domain-associated protein
MISIPQDLQSLETLYENCCSRRGFDPDSPLVEYRSKLVSSNAVALLPSYSGDLASKIYENRALALEELMTTSFPRMRFMLSEHYHRTLLSYDEYWAMRKEFARQFALSAFLTYILQIGDRTLHKISISSESGRMLNWEFYPNYNSQLHIDGAEPVPFRLSPNITEFIGEYLVKGVVSSALIGSAACVLKNQDIVKNFLYLFLRDDMLSWNSTRNPKILADDQTQQSMEQTSRVSVLENTLRILQRVQLLMSSGESGGKEDAPINEQADRLISAATRLESLGMMNPIWIPWF